MVAPSNASPASGMSPKERELFNICGDAPDPSGRTSARGMQSTLHLGRAKYGEPKVFYKSRGGVERLLTVDVYKVEGAPLEIFLFCPLCSTEDHPHNLRLTSDQKAIDYKVDELVHRGGRLNVSDPIGCTWEIDGTRAVGIVSTTNLCRWRVVIENNVARDV